ncbi:MAG: energy transducer TonB [Colwellia sp.]
MKKLHWTPSKTTAIFRSFLFSTLGAASFICLIPFMSFAQSELTPERSELITMMTPAVAVDRVNPRYPISAARNGDEGWVRLSYVINTEGRVEDVIVMDNEGGRFFVHEAKRALKKWRFTPAKDENNENIVSCQNSVQLGFKMGNQGADKKFIKLLKQSFASIDEGDLAKTAELIDKINKFKNKNSMELAWGHYTNMKYAVLNEDEQQTYISAKKASNYVSLKDSSFSDAASLHIMHNLLRLQIKKQLFSKAKDTFNKIEQYDTDYAKKLMSSFTPYMEQIDSLIASERDILVEGKIANNNWYHKLVRSKFSIGDINGQVDTLEVRCSNSLSTFSLKADDVFTIPDSWNDCSIFVKGDDNASFNLYEISDKSAHLTDDMSENKPGNKEENKADGKA